MADTPSFTVTPKLEARFWSKVAKGGPKDCWEWTAHLSQAGYGRIFIEGISRNACHASLAIAGKSRPPGLHALHSCDNRKCVNPAHLRWGTAKENGRDKSTRGRCPDVRGEKHPYSTLTEASVRRIYRQAGTLISIAKEYGVTISTVWAIKHRRLWRHLKL
jgi:hypothetical protein